MNIDAQRWSSHKHAAGRSVYRTLAMWKKIKEKEQV